MLSVKADADCRIGLMVAAGATVTVVAVWKLWKIVACNVFVNIGTSAKGGVGGDIVLGRGVICFAALDGMYWL